MIEWGDVDPDLRQALEKAGLDSVAGAFAFSQGQDLSKPDLGTRRRTRLAVTDSQGRQHELYLKRYGPGRWWQRLGKFTSPAQTEFEAIRRVRQAGVPTMREIVVGYECPLMDGRSFLVVSAVPGEAVERGGAKWFTHPDAAVVEAMTDKLAAMVRTLHQAGLVHRDLYTSHVFAHDLGQTADLFLIDLARVFRPRLWKFRWRVKDLAQLHYSMPAAWVEKYWPRFLDRYLTPSRTDQRDRWQRAILQKSESIRRRQLRKTVVSGGGSQGWPPPTTAPGQGASE
jgi:heptose I phosphotransferase